MLYIRFIGKIRSITTPTGKTASVSGGTCSWSVDEPEEIRKLIENIKSGERVEREPVYEKNSSISFAAGLGGDIC